MKISKLILLATLISAPALAEPNSQGQTKNQTASAVVSAASANAETQKDAFRMTILDAFKIAGKGVVLTGQVEKGSAEVGSWVCVPMLNGKDVGRQVTGLEMFRKVLNRVEVGENVGVLVDNLDHKQIARSAELVAGCADGS